MRQGGSEWGREGVWEWLRQGGSVLSDWVESECLSDWDREMEWGNTESEIVRVNEWDGWVSEWVEEKAGQDSLEEEKYADWCNIIANQQISYSRNIYCTVGKVKFSENHQVIFDSWENILNTKIDHSNVIIKFSKHSWRNGSRVQYKNTQWTSEGLPDIF